MSKEMRTVRSLQEEKDNTDSDKFHYNLALAYNELKMPEQALQESEEALKSTNFRLPALLLRSRIFLSQGSPSTALSQVQQGLLEKGLPPLQVFCCFFRSFTLWAGFFQRTQLKEHRRRRRFPGGLKKIPGPMNGL